MARHPKLDGTRVPSSYPNTNRRFVMASEGQFADYHRERADIARRYPLLIEFDRDERETTKLLREAAMGELRERVVFGVRELGLSGPYLIPV